MRQPLLIEGFNAIRQEAPIWFQRAMDLALESVQGRNEIAQARFEHIENNEWHVIRNKTKSHGTAARLKIKLWPELLSIISNCRDDIASPFIIHKKPVRLMGRDQRGKERVHPTQIMKEDLSREFAKAREASKFYAGMDEAARPTFHEIRALGADLKRKQGWPEAMIQKLMAHTDKQMTAHYLGKHETPWTEISANFADE
jgi:integrase